jgi:hypothetical protein
MLKHALRKLKKAEDKRKYYEGMEKYYLEDFYPFESMCRKYYCLHCNDSPDNSYTQIISDEVTMALDIDNFCNDERCERTKGSKKLTVHDIIEYHDRRAESIKNLIELGTDDLCKLEKWKTNLIEKYLSAKRLYERLDENMEQCRKLTRTFEKKGMEKIGA